MSVLNLKSVISPVALGSPSQFSIICPRSCARSRDLHAQIGLRLATLADILASYWNTTVTGWPQRPLWWLICTTKKSMVSEDIYIRLCKMSYLLLHHN